MIHKGAMQLEIILSAGSPKPIYEQIETQFKAQILDGTLQPGQSIPSMRALARSLTLYRAAWLDLNPEHVSHEAGFIVMDGRRGMLICNGRVARYADITRVVCASTWLANKIELYGRSRFPLILGFADNASLLEHCRALRDDITRARGAEPEFVLMKDDRAAADHAASA